MLKLEFFEKFRFFGKRNFLDGYECKRITDDIKIADKINAKITRKNENELILCVAIRSTKLSEVSNESNRLIAQKLWDLIPEVIEKLIRKMTGFERINFLLYKEERFF